MQQPAAVDSRLAIRVQHLARKRRPVARIALTLDCTEEAVMDALNMLGIPLPGEQTEPRGKPAPEVRADASERVPQQWCSPYGLG